MRIETLHPPLRSRARRRTCTTALLHATAGGSAESSIAWLRKIGLSYHYVIERDGLIYKCAPHSRVAFHAGRSLGPSGAHVNEYSVGIAFANDNIGEQVTLAQEAACLDLISALTKAAPDLKWITTHYLVSPGRKTDPAFWRFDSFAAMTDLIPWRLNEDQDWNYGL